MTPEGYRDLIRSFLFRQISASDFSKIFLEEFLKESVEMDDELFSILDGMWGGAEMYSPVEIPIMISEQQLREEAAEYLAKLEDYLAHKGS